MKTLYLHIGTIKTGTKAIQCFCWENPDALKKYGYVYPDLSSLCPKCTRVKNAHFLIEEIENEDKAIRKQQIQEMVQKGMEQVIALFSTYDNVILSDEGIYGVTFLKRKSLWKELKEYGEKNGFTVKVIVYLRRQDEFMISTWNQHIKAHSVNPEQTFDKFISAIPESRQLDYYKKLESIASVLGKENVIVRRFVKDAFFGGSIYADFLQAVGLKLTDEYRISKENRNQSLLGNAHEIMRIINGITDLTHREVLFLRNILRPVGDISNTKYPTAMLSKKEFFKFTQQYKRTNQLVAEQYLNQPGGDLFEYTPPTLPKWTADNPYMLHDVIRFVASGMLKLRTDYKKLQEDYKKLEKKVSTLSKAYDSLNKEAHQ